MSQEIIAERKRQELANPILPMPSSSTPPVQIKSGMLTKNVVISGILKGPASPKANKRVSFSGFRKVRYFLSPEKRRLTAHDLPPSILGAMSDPTSSGNKEPETKSAKELEILTESAAEHNRRTPKMCAEAEAKADTSSDRTRFNVQDHSTCENSTVCISLSFPFATLFAQKFDSNCP
ncbi:unnamed protein product [Rodentolepis nana]|uniref:TPX2_importin domain-containing protein n=1 Tax=Rodentolepis nana TaxID=102285 RepID=A0A0R3TZ10_RODNA|nr:unnamed protein product [Rodentolepis nana]